MLVQNFGALRQFVPAELKHNSKGWYIEYYKLNPIVQDLERVRIMMNRERKRCKTLTIYTSKVFTYRAPYESRTSNRTSKVLNCRRHLASLLVARANGLATNELPPNHRDCAVVRKWSLL